eukprot:2457549-Rhodomonas_salina.1
MIIARVVVGTWTRGSQATKIMPEMKVPGDSGYTCCRYDSLVDDEINPTIFVIQQPAAAYPAYILKYKSP